MSRDSIFYNFSLASILISSFVFLCSNLNLSFSMVSSIRLKMYLIDFSLGKCEASIGWSISRPYWSRTIFFIVCKKYMLFGKYNPSFTSSIACTPLILSWTSSTSGVLLSFSYFLCSYTTLKWSSKQSSI